MKDKFSDNLINFSNMLMLAHDRGEIIQLANKLNNLICKAIEMENAGELSLPQEKTKTLSAEIKFTKEEIDMMSKTFKKEFIANGCVAHIIKRPSGKNGFYYEIRYRRNGYVITVGNKDLSTAKKLFIEKTKYLGAPQTISRNKLNFGTIVEEWLEYKKGKVIKSTWVDYKNLISRFIPEELKSKHIKDIHTNDIDKLLIFDNDPRMYEDVRSLYNQIFKYAIASGIITHNPVTIIPFKRAERKTRKPLSTKQIKEFFIRLQQPEFESIRQIAYVLYFFGLRPCEIDNELHFENGFLICRNRKRKNGKIEYKKIPIPSQAREFINFDLPVKYNFGYGKFTKILKKALGDNLTPYNLRHTFISICAEYVRPDIVDVWSGDSPERLIQKVYIKFSDDFMIAQMNNVKFIT